MKKNYYENKRKKMLAEWKLKNKWHKDEQGQIVRDFSQYAVASPFADKTTYMRNYIREYRLKKKQIYE